MQEITIHDEYIKLGQALKLSGIAASGIDAKIMIQDGEVKYNGKTELQRGKKLYPGDTFEVAEKQFVVVK